MSNSDFFKKNNYTIIRNFLTPDVTVLLYEYCKLQANRVSAKYEVDLQSYNQNWDGRFNDPQAPGTYSHYGDPIMDSVLYLSLNKMNEHTGLDLLPQYSYWRLYTKGSDLKKHKDRESCEISTTLCLGMDTSNVEDNTYVWPIFMNGEEVNLNPGDMVIYRGCLLEHWREEYKGLNHAQVFLHYNDRQGPYNKLFDERTSLGLPKNIKLFR